MTGVFSRQLTTVVLNGRPFKVGVWPEAYLPKVLPYEYDLFFFFLDAIVPATYQVVFAGFVFNQHLSDFKNKHTAAKVL